MLFLSNRTCAHSASSFLIYAHFNPLWGKPVKSFFFPRRFCEFTWEGDYGNSTVLAPKDRSVSFPTVTNSKLRLVNYWMTKTHHIVIAIGLFERLDDATLKDCITDKKLTASEIRDELKAMRKSGLEFFPANGCDHYDNTGRCLGH